jgi:hypothetical protein
METCCGSRLPSVLFQFCSLRFLDPHSKASVLSLLAFRDVYLLQPKSPGQDIILWKRCRLNVPHMRTTSSSLAPLALAQAPLQPSTVTAIVPSLYCPLSGSRLCKAGVYLTILCIPSTAQCLSRGRLKCA